MYLIAVVLLLRWCETASQTPVEDEPEVEDGEEVEEEDSAGSPSSKEEDDERYLTAPSPLCLLLFMSLTCLFLCVYLCACVLCL
jgi:hypothetical protein